MRTLPPRRRRERGRTDNCFACASWLVIAGLGLALYLSGGRLETLPLWAKVVGPLAALALLAGAWFLGGDGGFAAAARGEEAPTPGDADPEPDPPAEGDEPPAG
ncbi:MAG: hypothetical protein D6731_23370 [Planctomycetota bacterium]|nr:MAG: hypothetical protein D6731_23370 [Planctomycetota bacterium]